METVSISRAAELLGVNKSTISRQVRDRIIPNRAEPGQPPRVNVEEARQARADFLDPSKRNRPTTGSAPAAPPAGELADAEPIDDADELDQAEENTTGERRSPDLPGGNDPAYRNARAEREQHLAELARIQVEQKGNKLVSRLEVASIIADAARLFKDAALQSSKTLAAEVVGKDAAEVERIIDAELRAMLARMVAAALKAAGE